VRRTLAPMLVALAALLTLAGCGGSNPAVTPTPTPTPREISATVGRATQASQSVHFVIDLSGKPVPIDTTGLTLLNTMEGDLKRPDSVLAVLGVTIGGAVSELRTVSLGGRQYLTNPLTRQWVCLAPGASFDPAVLFAPDKGIEFLLQEGYQDVTLIGTEDLGGRPHYHLSGVMAGEQLQAISLGLLGAGQVAVELWADVETLRATRLVLVDTATDAATPSTWTVNFSDYDKAVDVRAPVECP
jgi:lipoprotein LprG